MRVVITGAAGFIGSRFVEVLLEDATRLDYDDIVLLDALTYSGRLVNLESVMSDPRVTFVEASINDAAVTDELLRGAHAVVHFAAESHVDNSIDSARVFFETNVLGTQQLLDSARRGGVERFVHVSTDEVYGSIAEGSWREDHVLEPNSPYSSSKAGSDLAALAYHRTFGLAVMVTRCSNNYGPRQFPEKVLPLFVTNLVDGRMVPLYGDGLNVREWLHVDDHCRALMLVLEHGRPGEIYNIGGETELTNKELTERVLTLCGRDESMVASVPDRLGHDRRYSIDWSKIRHELGYEPRVDFDEGLASTVAWYHDHEDWWRPLKDRQP
ncbi:MAG: dTDP-glucose 4,6-dehydratase [Acidimicrobiales bacterium]|jgi:dTDP-glucose 4,6-dehydratase